MRPSIAPYEPVIQQAASEADCPHWLPGVLNHEPETVWCVRHGEELPCSACSTTTSKET
jgi:hypothetical protein